MSAPTQNYHLDGNGDYFSGADHAAWDIASAATFGLWILRDPTQDKTVAYLLDRQNTFSVYIDADNRVNFVVSGATGTLRSNHRIKPEHIYFIVVQAMEVGTSLYMAIYINGALDNHQILTSAAWPAGTDTAIYVGAEHTPAYYFKGHISSVLGTSDQLSPGEIAEIYNSASGQITDLSTAASHTIIIDVDTEGDLVNAGTGTNPFVATNAVARSYMGLWQSHSRNGRMILVPEGETKYATYKHLLLQAIHWYGDTIMDGDAFELLDKNSGLIFKGIATSDDTGETWYFDNKPCEGLTINALGHGVLEIELA
jgi:hypothetical protein